jgi:Glutaminase
MDARTDMVVGSTGRTGEILQPPLLGFLARCHAEIAGDHSGAVADYIPELTKADAGDFGISIATTDGYVYEVGDSDLPFTIQSIAKAFVFALALETIGAEKVESLIGSSRAGMFSIRSGCAPTIAPSIRWSMPALSPARV